MNVFTDFVLVALPLQAVWRLQMSVQNKLQISAIIALGILSVTLANDMDKPETNQATVHPELVWQDLQSSFIGRKS